MNIGVNYNAGEIAEEYNKYKEAASRLNNDDYDISNGYDSAEGGDASDSIFDSLEAEGEGGAGSDIASFSSTPDNLDKWIKEKGLFNEPKLSFEEFKNKLFGKRGQDTLTSKNPKDSQGGADRTTERRDTAALKVPQRSGADSNRTPAQRGNNPVNPQTARTNGKEPQRKLLGSGSYTADGKKSAESAVDDSILSKKAVTLPKDQQMQILKDAGIDINGNIAGKDESLLKKKDKDGTVQYYRVVNDNGKTKIIHTTMNNGKAQVKVYDAKAAGNAKPANQTDRTSSSSNPELRLNGEIDENVAQSLKTGDCWLVSGVLSMNQTEAGKKIIKDSIIDNGNGTVTVKFAGVNKEVKLTKAEIQKFNTDNNKNDAYSNGDDDMLAIELAYSKIRQEVRPQLEGKGVQDASEPLKGGSPLEIIKALSPKDKCILETAAKNDSNKIDKILREAAKNPNKSLSVIIQGTHSAQQIGGGTYKLESVPGHALAITKVTDKEVTFVDPYNSGKKITMTIEEFKKFAPDSLMSAEIKA